MDVLRWLLELGCPWSVIDAAQAPHMVAALGDIQRMQRRPVGMRDMITQCAMATRHGKLEMLKWLLGPSSRFTEPAFAHQQMVDLDQLEDANGKDLIAGSSWAHMTFPRDLASVSLEFLLVLAKCGCSMRETHPHLILKLVQSWYCFKGLVRWAEHHDKAPAQWRGPRGGQRAKQAWQAEPLRQYIRLPPDVQDRIEAEAFFSPAAAKRLS